MSENNNTIGTMLFKYNIKSTKPPIYPSQNYYENYKRTWYGRIKRRITDNLKDLVKMIEWNEQNGIKVFRLSSELFMHKTNPKVEDYSFDLH